MPPLAFKSAEYLLLPRSGPRDRPPPPIYRVQVVQERAWLRHPPPVVAEQLDHLVLEPDEARRPGPGPGRGHGAAGPGKEAAGYLVGGGVRPDVVVRGLAADRQVGRPLRRGGRDVDRKSTRLNSSHPSISYAVFC